MEIPTMWWDGWVRFSGERGEARHGNIALPSKLCVLRALILHTYLLQRLRPGGSLVGITAALQFTRTHSFEPLDVTPDGGEVLVSVLGDGYNIFDPNAPQTLISREDIVIDVFGSTNWRQQMG
jgi:hypothetical protein